MSYSSTILAEAGLTHYWRMNAASGTTETDQKGTDNGTYTGGFTLAQAGAVADGDTAVAFNGSTGKCTLASLPSSATNNFSLECWVKLASLSNQAAQFVCVGDNTGGGGWGVGIGDGLGGSGLKLTGILLAVANLDSGYTFADTNWHHVVMVRDAGTIKWYVDGVQTGNTSATAPLAPAGNAAIGARTNAPNDQFLNGSIDEVAIYSSALSAASVLAHYQAAQPVVYATGPPPISAHIRLQAITPSGQGYDLTDQAEGLQWSSVNPGGDERCSFTLKRKWFAGAPEIALGNTVRVIDGLDVLWQGRVDENDRAVADAEAIGITAYGKGIALKDVESYVDVIVDQDLTAWGDAPLNRKAAYGATDFASFSWASDPAGGLVCALPNQALGTQVVAESWYIAPPGVVIAKAYYKGSDTNLPAAWEAATIFDCLDDSASATDSNAITLDNTLRTVTFANARRYAMVREASNGTASTPAAGANRRFAKLGLYSNHGLTLTDPGDGNPFGVLASNAVPYLVGKASGITARRIDTTTFVIPQLAWKDGVVLEQTVIDATRFDQLDWGTWGPSSALDASTGGYFDMTARDTTTQHWFALRSDCDDIALNVEMATLYNQVDVIYQDASGQQQIATRTTAVATLDALGITKKALLQGGTLTTAGAQQLGDTFLALSAQQPPARGSILLSGPLTHYRRGKLLPHLMRADGSNLRIPDVLPSSDLFSLSASPDRRTTFPIKRITVDASGAVPKVTAELDQSNDTLAILQARFAAEAQVALGSGG